MSTKNVLKTFSIALVALIGLGSCVGLEYGTVEQEIDPPGNVTASAVSDTRISVSWASQSGMGAFKYYVFQSESGGPFLFAGSVLEPNTSRLMINLLPNTTYSYQIVAVHTDGSESVPSSPPASATTLPGPPPPSGVMAQAISESRINVSWSAVPNAAKYLVRRATNPNGPYTHIGSVLDPATSFLATNLQSNTTYYFRVVTVDTNGSESAPSTPPASATTFGFGGFEGHWKFEEGTGSFAFDSSGFNRTGTLSGGAVFSTTDKPQLDDNLSSVSFTSDASSLVSVPYTPGFALTGGRFTIAMWVKIPVGADVRLLGMRGANCGALGWELAQNSTNRFHFVSQSGVRSSNNFIPVGTWTHVAVTNNLNTFRMYMNGIEVAGGTYAPNNTVQAPLSMGHVGGCAGGGVLLDDVQIHSRAFTGAEIETLGTLPPPPTNLVVTGKTSRSLSLAWDPVPNASSYIISRGTGLGDEAFYTHSPANPPTFEADHLEPATQSSWTVRAVVNGLFSNPSNVVVDTTLGPPAAPSNVVATLVSPTRIRIDWDAVPNATKYYIHESINGGGFAYRGSVVAPGVSFLAVNLMPGTTYSYQVQAEDNVQTVGPFSSPPASATTP